MHEVRVSELETKNLQMEADQRAHYVPLDEYKVQFWELQSRQVSKRADMFTPDKK